jgi:hypothetical protein
MCVIIKKIDHDVEYDSSFPLNTQIETNDQLFIDYKENCADVESLLKEIERLRFSGEMPECDIKVNYNNTLCGFKLKKQMDKIKNDINVSELIKLMVLSYQNTNKKLEDLINACVKCRE